MAKVKYRPARLQHGKIYSRQLGLWLERGKYQRVANGRPLRINAMPRQQADALAAELRAVQEELAALRQRSDKPSS